MASSPHCALVVLGDIGRSPRMQYHARSLLRNGFNVSITGYDESPLLEELQTSTNLSIYDLPRFPVVSSVPRILLLPFKALWMLVTLFWTLMTMPRAKFILVQNPPSIPTLAVAWFACRLRGAKFCIDWHNFGFSILALSSPKKGWLVSVAHAYERFFGGLGNVNFCVSESMARELHKNWNLSDQNRARVLHDCPPEFFRKASAKERTELLNREPLLSFQIPSNAIICVTATSFTSDEKLDMLLDAIVALDLTLESKSKSCHMAFVVTGKGDGRAAFEIAAKRLNLKHCSLYVTYFEQFSDYALMLGSANVGLSFHASSSGFDLPMKIVDMFGCGLLVCSIRYACIDELVKENVNGLIFDDANHLAQQLFVSYDFSFHFHVHLLLSLSFSIETICR